MKQNRVLALALAFALVLVMAASFAFVSLHADHVCDRDHCQICEQIAVCLSHIQIPAAVSLLITLVMTVFHACGGTSAIRGFRPAAGSLVAWKVKLSD